MLIYQFIYLKIVPTLCTYNDSKKNLYKVKLFERVAVAATTTIIRKVHLHEPKPRYYKLSIL